MIIYIKEIILITGLSISLGLIRFLTIENQQFTIIKTKRVLQEGIMNGKSDFVIPELLTEPMMIDSKIAYNLFNTKKTIFIDARDPGDYLKKHIKNAINIPYDYYEEYQEQITNMNVDNSYVVYCSGGECSLSLDLADYLFELGFFNIFIYENGLPEWIDLEYPTE
jgi:rhodanese-related sulfurtransferase